MFYLECRFLPTLYFLLYIPCPKTLCLLLCSWWRFVLTGNLLSKPIMATLNIMFALALLYSTSSGALIPSESTCVNKPAGNMMVNGDFESNYNVLVDADGNNKTHTTFGDSGIAMNWTTMGKVQFGRNGNLVWGGANSENGDVYAILRRGARLTQTLTGLKDGTYILMFQVSERRSSLELLTVLVNGKHLAFELNPSSDFRTFSAHFAPHTNGVAVVEFINSSPNGDLSVLLDDVQVYESKACGTGATCHEHNARVTDYVCKCDQAGYSGLDVTNGQASCLHSSDPTTDDKVAALQLRVDDLEEENGDLQTRVSQLEKQIANLINALKQTQLSTSDVMTPAANLTSTQDHPEILSTDKGGLNFVSRGDVTLNGEPIITNSQGKEMVVDAIVKALSNIADTL
eukprot:m.112074 g.112074  ORF g.112074 m.112074 type:complete len:401 (+) comp14080_c1_seq4:1876-3078(+)